MTQLLTGSEDVCFRDRYSVSLFPQLENVRYAPDILLSEAVVRPVLPKSPTIVVSVIDLGDRPGLVEYQGAYQRKLVDLIKAAQEVDLDICLMGFCSYEGDDRAVRQIFHKAEGVSEAEHIRTFIYDGDTAAALAVLGGARAIVATRFHAMILGWALGRPVMPIAYSDKTRSVIEDMGYDGPWTRVAQINTLDSREALEALLKVQPQDFSPLAAESLKHFDALDRFLRKT